MTPPATIAILDDDAGVRAALASLVRALGHQARTYACAQEFLEGDVPGEARRDPDCLITDVQMPGLAGDALQARLIAEGRPLPMIFMTAFPRPDLRARVMAAGAVGFLEKPVDGDEIARCLGRALASRPPHTLV